MLELVSTDGTWSLGSYENAALGLIPAAVAAVERVLIPL